MTAEGGSTFRPSYLPHRRCSRVIDRPIRPTSLPANHAGRELAPAFTTRVNRLLWRRRARPSTTLDKMRTELSERQITRGDRRSSSPEMTRDAGLASRPGRR